MPADGRWDLTRSLKVKSHIKLECLYQILKPNSAQFEFSTTIKLYDAHFED